MTRPCPPGAGGVHELLLQLRVPTQLDLSPDGRRVAYALPDSSGTGTDIEILEVGGERPAVVLPTPGTGSTACPRWAAKGNVLVAAYSDPLTEPGFLVALDPATGDHLWRKRVPGFVENIVVSADNVLVLFADPGSEQDGMHFGRRFADSNDPWVDRVGKRWRRLAVAGLTTSRLDVLELNGWTIWDVDINAAGAILAVASRDPRPSGYYEPNLILTDVDGTEPRQLWDGDGRQLSRPRLMGDGAEHAYVLSGLSIVSGTVHRVDLRNNRVAALPHLDDVTDLGRLPDGRFWFAGWTEQGVQIGTLDERGELEYRTVTPGLVTGRDSQPSLVVDPSASRAVAVWEDATHPPEISVIDLPASNWRQITDLNYEAADAVSRIEREWVRWKSSDGTEVSGLLILPAGHDEPMPLVTILHGGPTWLVPDGFSPGEANGLALPIVHNGAAVLMPNPRGSSGRGQAFAQAIVGRMGETDLDDVLSGIDTLVDRGVADPNRLGVMGLSYGGFLSAWALTQTDRFRAAVVMSGVSDWLSFCQTSNIGLGFVNLYHVGCDPESVAGRSRLLDRSPAHRLPMGSTPVLIIHGQEDRVTPVGQAEQLFGAWTAAGNPTELVIYPREGHEFLEPEHLRDTRERVLAWLEKHGVTGQTERT